MKRTTKQPTNESRDMNRTGISLAPERVRDLIETAQAMAPRPVRGAKLIPRYELLSRRQTMGSIPTPQSADITGFDVLLDKLGERLAFERTGVRLYEALIGKCEALSAQDLGVPIRELQKIRKDEHEHFTLLQQAITDLGEDPTVLTPGANVVGVIGAGLVQILTDPRATIAQCFQTILSAELADNDGWLMLKNLAAECGEDELAQEFEAALQHEDEHLEKVRAWLPALMVKEAGIKGNRSSLKQRKAEPPRRKTA